MKALTLHQPWAWAVGAGLATVINRDAPPPWRLLRPGDELAIHAGQREVHREDLWTVRDGARRLGREAEVPALRSHEFGLEFGRGRIVAVVRLESVVQSADELPEQVRPWFVGRYGWVFSNVRQLNLGSAPRCAGEPSVWELPGEVERMVSAQLFQPAGDLWRRTA